MKPSNRLIRVLVADDSATARACVCRYLELEGRFEIVATASDGLQLVQKAMRLRRMARRDVREATTGE